MKPNCFAVQCLTAIFLTGPLLGGTDDVSTTTGVSPISTSSDTQQWLEASVSVGYETLHVYRGADSSFGNANIWEAIDIEIADLFHFNLYNGNSFNGEYGELTPSAYFHKDLGFLTASVGMIWYHFPGEEGVDSEEYYLQLSKDLGAGFSASGWFSYNARSEGWYHELKVNHSFDLADHLKLESSVALGISEGYRSGGDGLDNLTISIGLPISVTENITVRPSVGYAFALDAMDTDNEGWAGLTASYRF